MKDRLIFIAEALESIELASVAWMKRSEIRDIQTMKPRCAKVIPLILPGFRKLLPGYLAILVVVGFIATAYADTFDNFNDGNDDGWLHYDPIPGKYSFPIESGSTAYKMQSPWGCLLSPGRIGSINMQEPAQTKFHVEVDLLNWTYNWGEDIGLLARIQEPIPSFFLPEGYALLFRNDRDGQTKLRKLMIVKSEGGIHFPIFLAKGRMMKPAPDPSGDYRLKFWSADGYLWGQMIDKSTGQAIIMWDGNTFTDRISAVDDGDYPRGRSGLIAYVHIVDYEAEGVSPIFDNFYSGIEAPQLNNP